LLQELCDFRKGLFDEGEKVSGWSVMLKSENDLAVDKKEMSELNTARDIICGSLKAWAEHAKGTKATDSNDAYSERNQIRERIKNKTVAALLLSGPRETRARKGVEEPQLEGQGKMLANLLKNRSKRKAGGKGAV
jgi:hypothetical protein